MGTQIVHPTLCPFLVEQIQRHFWRPVNEQCGGKIADIIEWLRPALEVYERDVATECLHPHWGLDKIDRMSTLVANQLVWSIICFMRFFHSDNSACRWAKLLEWSLVESPPIDGMGSWAECLAGRLNLQFGVELPVTERYQHSLVNTMAREHPIGLVRAWLEAKRGQSFLPGIDSLFRVLLVNLDNGFSAVFLPVVLGDIIGESDVDLYQTALGTSVDALLESCPEDSPFPLNRTRADRTVLILVSPTFFRRNPQLRLYSRIMMDLRRDPRCLAGLLPPRTDVDWPGVTRRIGWITWEACNLIVPGACPWVEGGPGSDAGEQEQES